MATFKLQSAMEYLMTYGWAILIIAVVLGALFGLGFFNSANLAPKVTTGSCQIYRPFGPGTTTQINTEGVCNNELPQYVVQFSPTSGATSTPGGIATTDTSINTTAGGYNTVSFWMLYKGNGAAAGSTAVSLSSAEGVGASPTCIGITSTGTTFYGVSATSPASLQNIWVYVVAEIKNGQIASTNYGTATGDRLYINGVLQSSAAAGCTPVTASMYANSIVEVGNLYSTAASPSAGSSTFNGFISNVQIYSYALPANDTSAQYTTGIGGIPQALNNVVAWYQLNGNGQDYSGNLNNGSPANAIYTSSWTSSYTAP